MVTESSLYMYITQRYHGTVDKTLLRYGEFILQDYFSSKLKLISKMKEESFMLILQTLHLTVIMNYLLVTTKKMRMAMMEI